MGNFQGGGNRSGGFRGGNSGGRPSFQKRSFGGDRGGDRENVMHKATCSECGKTCEVPFRPSGDKPVYCSDCFNKKKDGGGDRAPRRDFGDRAPRRDFNDRPAPRADFARPMPNNDDTKNQLKDISMKLDRLVNAIEKLTQPKGEAFNTKVETKNTPSLKAVITKAIAIKAPVKKAGKKVVAKKKK